MRVLTKQGALEKLKQTLDDLWEWSIKLYWKYCELLGKALNKFKTKYTMSKRFRYFINALGIMFIVFLVWGMISSLYHTVVHADSGYYLDTNHDGKQTLTIDAGHGFNTSGKRAYDDSFREWQINDRVAKKIEEGLESRYNVDVIRVDDITGQTDVGLRERVNRAVEAKSDLHISIHQNAFGGTAPNNISGTETFYHFDEESRRLADKITENMARNMGRNNRMSKSANELNLFIPREMTKQGIPSVLAEGINMFNEEDVQYMMTEKYANDYAEAVIEAIVKQYNLISK
jgi:N-acetylmuramoyl-L-alanine amidase